MQDKENDCSCPACGSGGFDGYCGSCKHKADKGVNWYTDEPVELPKD